MFCTFAAPNLILIFVKQRRLRVLDLLQGNKERLRNSIFTYTHIFNLSSIDYTILRFSAQHAETKWFTI